MPKNGLKLVEDASLRQQVLQDTDGCDSTTRPPKPVVYILQYSIATRGLVVDVAEHAQHQALARSRVGSIDLAEIKYLTNSRAFAPAQILSQTTDPVLVAFQLI